MLEGKSAEAIFNEFWASLPLAYRLSTNPSKTALLKTCSTYDLGQKSEMRPLALTISSTKSLVETKSVD